MNKCKAVKKYGISQIIMKSQKGQQLSEREVYAINNNKVKGLLRLEVVKKGTAFKLVYDITGFITLTEYLRSPLNKASFAGILQDVLTTLKSMRNAFFNQKFILMDFNHVMVNPATQNIYFVYVPLQGFEGNISLREFLLNIIQYASFEQGEDTNYVREYINILNSGINFSEFDLEEYINGLMGQKTAKKEKTECPQCGAKLPKGTNYCSSCGAKVSGNTGGNGIYNPLKEPSSSDENNKEKKGNTGGFSTNTIDLRNYSGGTTVFRIGRSG